MSAPTNRVCHFVIDCSDLDRATEFWTTALYANVVTVNPQSTDIYRKLRLPNSDINILLQQTDDPPKTEKSRMHLDIETEDVDAEVRRLVALGAIKVDHQQTRGWDFWILADPDGNEICVLDATALSAVRPR